jgi:alpha-D-xyloside xylohydrolase
VREGTILPLTADSIEWSDALDSATLELRIYPGRDASFTLYEDSGDGYQCEQGDFSTIRLRWDEQRQTLYIGKRQGGYIPPSPTRRFRVLLIGSNEEHSVIYDGKAIKLSFKRP